MELLVDKYDKHFSEITLKPTDGGRFEVIVNSNTVFSKLESDRFPEDDEVVELVAKEIGAN
ncbi:MAG: SelT/SelW/SelH family protein [Sphaerobacteraceae bacterium]|nr:MAG: SelT/SelW/SelH family protein [Sphaerobacteraceae bacterium]